MLQVTQILAAIEQGDPRAVEQLLPLVYDELRRLASQKLAQVKARLVELRYFAGLTSDQAAGACDVARPRPIPPAAGPS